MDRRNKMKHFKNLEMMAALAKATKRLEDELDFQIAVLQLKRSNSGQLIKRNQIESIGMWGLRPKTPGYGIASIKPQTGESKNSSIEVPTIKGIIKGNYEYVSARLQKYTIEIPANLMAEFELTATDEKAIKLNGEIVSTVFGAIRLLPGVNRIEVVVNSF